MKRNVKPYLMVRTTDAFGTIYFTATTDLSRKAP